MAHINTESQRTVPAIVRFGAREGVRVRHWPRAIRSRSMTGSLCDVRTHVRAGRPRARVANIERKRFRNPHRELGMRVTD